MDPLLKIYDNLPGIVCTAASQQSAVYDGPYTVLGCTLRATVAGVAATDAEVTAQIVQIEVRDDDNVIVDRWTPDELKALFAHYHAKTAAYPVDAGNIEIVHTPDNMPWAGTGMLYGLGRKLPNGGRAKYKVTVQFGAGPLTIDSLVPTMVLDMMDVDQPTAEHIRLSRWTSMAFAGTGENPHEDIVRDLNATAVHELFFDISTGTILNFTVLRNGEQWLRQTDVSILDQEMVRAGLTAIADRQALLFNTLNDRSSILPLADRPRLQIIPNWSFTPAGTYDVLRVLEYKGRTPA